MIYLINEIGKVSLDTCKHMFIACCLWGHLLYSLTLLPYMVKRAGSGLRT